MNDKNTAFPMMISVVVMNEIQLRGVYALLGGTSALAVVQSQPGNVSSGDAKKAIAPTSAGDETSMPANQESAGTGLNASQPTEIASPSSVVALPEGGETLDFETDAHGHRWSADLHASTKSKTKEGLWRMKPGVNRPDPLPGFPVENADTGTSQATDTPSAISETVTVAESAPTATATEEEDEFAAFRAAAAASDETDKAAAASVPARSYSDADLGALCNQAAVKLGDPNPVKEIITRFVPEGQVSHSRNIPEDKRAEFVKAVEAKAGIEFAG